MLPSGRLNGRRPGSMNPFTAMPNSMNPPGNPLFFGGNQMNPQQGNPFASGAANQVNAQQNNNMNAQQGRVMGPPRRRPLSPRTGIVWLPPGARLVDPSEVPASARLPWGATPMMMQRSGPRGQAPITSNSYAPAPRLVPYDGRPGWGRRGACDLSGLVIDGVNMMREEKEYMWHTICSNKKCKYEAKVLYLSTERHELKKCKKCRKGIAVQTYVIDMDPETR